MEQEVEQAPHRIDRTPLLPRFEGNPLLRLVTGDQSTTVMQQDEQEPLTVAVEPTVAKVVRRSNRTRWEPVWPKDYVFAT